MDNVVKHSPPMGLGIPEEQLDILFEPFVQLEAHFTREHEGTGLGLALVSRLVEMHGGRIELESEVNKGSRFTIILPASVYKRPARAALADSEATEPDAIHDADEKSNTAFKARVLIVDDTAANISHVQHYLEMLGYQVAVAVDGLDGVDKATELLPDITLMDIQMPGINGFEAMRRLRANERTKGLQIIATTAMAMERDRQQCFDAGADSYLAKPYSLKQLEAMINEYLLVTR